MLREIVRSKKEAVEQLKRQVPLETLKSKTADLPVPRDFWGKLKESESIALIAEIKKASPSKGLIRADFDPIQVAVIYEKNGASAISVLTEERYFQGNIQNLRQVRERVQLPLLRKDFIVDEYQIYEARVYGADAVLLIAALLSVSQLTDYLGIADQLGLAALVEVHSEDELQQVLSTPAEIIGINNRNLKTFEVDLNTTFRLMDLVPEEKTVVSESGITTREEILRLEQAGLDAVLVGETLMREPDIGKKLRELLGEYPGKERES